MRSVEFAKTCNNPATTMPWRVKLFVGQTRRSCINRHDKKVAASGTCDILSTRTKTCISWITAGFKISDLQNIRQSRTSEYAISFLDLLIRSSATIQKLNFWFPKTGRWGSTYHHFLTIQFRLFCEHLSSVWAIVSPRSRAMKIWAMWSSDRRSGNGPPGPVWRHVGNFQDHRCRLDLFINFFRSRRSQVKMFFLLASVKNGERCVFFLGGSGVRSLPWRRTEHLVSAFQMCPIDYGRHAGLWRTPTPTEMHFVLLFIGVFKGVKIQALFRESTMAAWTVFFVGW